VSPNLVFQRLDLPVRTARLSLRPAHLDDAESAWRYRRLDTVNRWLTEVPRSLDDYRSRFDPDRLARTLIIEREGRVIGDLMLKLESPWAQAEVEAQAHDVQAELGWVLDPAQTGNGYATEAVRELMRLCFDELRLRRVVAVCFADNETSWRLMERVGMRRELHAVRESLHRSGEWLDVFGYALLFEEWNSHV
jgi:RimJ/RimL family protein N-acetyltransferase